MRRFLPRAESSKDWLEPRIVLQRKKGGGLRDFLSGTLTACWLISITTLLFHSAVPLPEVTVTTLAWPPPQVKQREEDTEVWHLGTTPRVQSVQACYTYFLKTIPRRQEARY